MQLYQICEASPFDLSLDKMLSNTHIALNLTNKNIKPGYDCFSRTGFFIGEHLSKLSNAKIIIFGVGKRPAHVVLVDSNSNEFIYDVYEQNRVKTDPDTLSTVYHKTSVANGVTTKHPDQTNEYQVIRTIPISEYTAMYKQMSS